MKIVCLLFATGSAFMGPAKRMPLTPRFGAPDVDEIKKSVMPADIGETSQAVYSLTGTVLGVAGLVKPAWLAEKTLGIATSGQTDVIIRGASIASLLLSARVGREGDSAAAQSAALWFGAWYYILRGSTGVAGKTATALGLLALSAVRRSGGLYNLVTTLDTTALSAVLPKNRDVSMQNIVGMQMMGWGLGLWFMPGYLTTNIMGGKAAISAVYLKGLAINNLLLGGKVMAGSEQDAKTNGLLFFAGWSALTLMGRNAGIITGQYALPVLAWNAACAVYTIAA